MAASTALRARLVVATGALAACSLIGGLRAVAATATAAASPAALAPAPAVVDDTPSTTAGAQLSAGVVPTTTIPRPAPVVAATSAPPAVPTRSTTTTSTAGAVPAKAKAKAKTPATGTGTWALVVGNGDYAGATPDLPLARRDAEIAADAFSRHGVAADHQRVLLDAAATRPGILAGIEWLNASAGPDATVLVMFAGHAYATGSAEVALVTNESDTLSNRELGAAFDGLAARKVWFTFATCYAARFETLLRPGRVLTAASGADEQSYDNASLGASYLGHYLFAEALGNDPTATDVATAFRHADANIARDYPNRRPLEIQVQGDSTVIRL